MPRFGLGLSGAEPDAITARSTDIMLAQGQYRVPIDSGYGDVYRPFATGFSDQRILTLETLYDFFINNVPDPDTAMAQDPNFDEKMENHPDVAASMRTRELTVASLPWRIDASKKEGIDHDLAGKVQSYVEDVFNSMVNLVEMYRQMERAVLLGGQGHEWVWAKVDGHERPVEYYPVHKSRFVFDRLGNQAVLTRTTPVWGAYVNRPPHRMPNSEFAWSTPGGRFVYHKYMAEGGPWQRPAAEGYLYWGRGEDTRLYIPVQFDHFVIRFRMKWLEKHGMPLTILHHPDNVSSSQIDAVAKSLRGESIVRLPKPVGKEKDHWYALEFIDPPKGGYDAFQQFQDGYVKQRIERLLLGSSGVYDGGSGGGGGESGGYAASVNRRDAGPQIIFRYDAMNISESLNVQLIPYIVWGRWPGLDDKYFPRHVMEPKEEKDQKQRMELAEMAARLVPIRKDEIYEAAGFDRPKEGDEDVVYTPEAADDPFAGMAGLGGPIQPGGMPKEPIGAAPDNEVEQQREARAVAAQTQ